MKTNNPFERKKKTITTAICFIMIITIANSLFFYNSTAKAVEMQYIRDNNLLGNIPDQIINNGENFQSINIYSYCNPPPKVKLFYKIDNNPTHIFVSISSTGIATITYSPGFVGSEIVIFNVSYMNKFEHDGDIERHNIIIEYIKYYDLDTVTFTVNAIDNPILSCSPGNYNFGDMSVGQTSSTSFEIQNSGTGTLSYNFGWSDSWIDVNPTSGTSTGESDLINVDIDTTGLSDGAHNCDLLITSNGGNGVSTITVNVIAQVVNNPIASFTFNPSNPTISDLVTFTDESSDSDGSIVSWSWDFDDEESSNVQNPTHRFKTPGTYSVCLTVTDNDGLTDTFSDDIVVIDSGSTNVPPVADFSFSPTNPTIEDIVAFTDESSDSDGSIVSWSWDFNGDGTEDSDVQNPTCVFESSGDYEITLIVEDNEGATDDYQVTINVVDSGNTDNPPSKVTGLSVSDAKDGKLDLSWNAASDDGSISFYKIYFDDGTFIAESTSTSFTDTGLTNGLSYTYQVSAVDDADQEGEKSASASGTPTESSQDPDPTPPSPPSPPSPPEPTPPTNHAPKIPTVNGPGIGLVDVMYTFNATSTDSDGHKICYRFDWGDDVITDWTDLFNSGETIDLLHLWNETGTYQVKAQAKDEKGLKSDWSEPINITIVKPTNISKINLFAFIKYSVDEKNNGNVEFDASESQGETSYTCKWDFNGDGVVDSTEEKATFTYEKGGEYIVCLTVEDDEGNTNTDTKTIEVPEPSTGASDTNSAASQASGGIDSLIWIIAIAAIVAGIAVSVLLFYRHQKKKQSYSEFQYTDPSANQAQEGAAFEQQVDQIINETFTPAPPAGVVANTNPEPNTAEENIQPITEVKTEDPTKKPIVEMPENNNEPASIENSTSNDLDSFDKDKNDDRNSKPVAKPTPEPVKQPEVKEEIKQTNNNKGNSFDRDRLNERLHKSAGRSRNGFTVRS